MLEMCIKGGGMMVFLVACSLVALAALLDRGVAYYKYNKLDNRALRSNVLKLLADNKIREAAHLCARTPGPISAVLLTGIQCYHRHKNITTRSESITAVMKETMQDYSVHVMSAVESRLILLSTVSNAAPLFGMCGTVTGMISSFNAMATAKGLDAGLVAAGISEALITTAAGLLIALFAVFPYYYFVGSAEKIGIQIDETISELIDFVATEMETRESKTATR